MARVIIDLPEDLHRAAAEAGLPLGDICREALASALGMRYTTPRREDGRRRVPGAASATATVVRRGDDQERHVRGRRLGFEWAASGVSLAEILEIAAWARHPWRQFALDPRTNTLPAAYCAELGLEAPVPDDAFWLERDAFTLGIVDGVNAFCDHLSSQLP